MPGGNFRGPLPPHLRVGRSIMAGPVTGGYVPLIAVCESITATAIAFGWLAPANLRLHAIGYYSLSGAASADLDVYQNSTFSTTGASALLNGTVALDAGASGLVTAAIIDNISADDGATLIQNRDIARGQAVFGNITITGGSVTDLTVVLWCTIQGHIVTDSSDDFDNAAYEAAVRAGSFTPAAPEHIISGRSSYPSPMNGGYLQLHFGNLSKAAGGSGTNIRIGTIMPFGFRIEEIQWQSVGGAAGSVPTANIDFNVSKNPSSFATGGSEVEILSADVSLDANDDGRALVTGTTPTLITTRPSPGANEPRELDRGDRLFSAITHDATGDYDQLVIGVNGFATGNIHSDEAND